MRVPFKLILLICGINSVITENRKDNESKPTISKCCKINEHVKVKPDVNGIYRKHCQKPERPLDSPLDLSDIVVYDKNYEKTNYSSHDMFDVLPAKFPSDRNFRQQAFDLMVKPPNDLNMYTVSPSVIFLIETGDLIVELPNTYNRYMPVTSENYCADYTVSNKNKVKQRFWVYFKPDVEPKNQAVLTSGLLITSVFLLLVIVVYALLKELRNLCGMILMAYMSSLFSAFMLLALLRILMNTANITPDGCVGLSCTIYFSFLAAFCWMNVMSYDIWWTFRGYAKARPIHRRGETFKFLMYCIYAFGVPLAMTIFFRVVNSLELTHMPGFVKPMIPLLGCFLVDGQKLVYLYIPMLIMIVFNWVLFLMTAFNIWRLSRGTAVLDSAAAGTPAAHRSQMQRFLVYLKLSIVMGLNWLLEVVSFLVPSLQWFWYISDTYNILIGVIIFVIFVCKPKILKKLAKLMKEQKKRKWAPGNSTKSNNSSVDSSTQETQSLQICANPKGPTAF